MADSTVDAPIVEDKIGDEKASAPMIKVSVSFGRFENDSLSWEKWSSFSPNKYLEEVAKCSTPGSVAQKAAYFEAHYKKIAARNVEQVENEKPIDYNFPTSDVSDPEGHVGIVADVQSGFSLFDGWKSAEEIDGETFSKMMETVSKSDYLEDSGKLVLDCQKTRNLLVVESKEEMGDKVAHPELIESNEKLEVEADSLNLDDTNKASLVIEEEIPKGSLDMLEQPPEVASEPVKLNKTKVGNLKHDSRSHLQKVISTNKKQHLLGEKKKVVSSVYKSPPTTAPRLPKPTATPSVMSSSEKTTDLSLMKSKRPSAVEASRVNSISLHMSLNLDSGRSDSISCMTTRKSLIMEKMGDKDIVRRAFKTFQNSISDLRSSNDERTSRSMKVTRESEKKNAAHVALQKENKGAKKAVETVNGQSSRMGTRCKSASSRSGKGAGVEEKKGKTAPSFNGFGSIERAGKEKQITKEAIGTLHSRKAKKLPVGPKSKDEKTAKVEDLTQSLNMKSRPIPVPYRGQRTSKSPVVKVTG